MQYVKLEKAISPVEYLNILLKVDDCPKITTCLELRQWLDQNGYSEYWDRPLSEIDEIVANELEVVLVLDSAGNYRWFEI